MEDSRRSARRCSTLCLTTQCCNDRLNSPNPSRKGHTIRGDPAQLHEARSCGIPAADTLCHVHHVNVHNVRLRGLGPGGDPEGDSQDRHVRRHTRDGLVDQRDKVLQHEDRRTVQEQEVHDSEENSAHGVHSDNAHLPAHLRESSEDIPVAVHKRRIAARPVALVPDHEIDNDRGDKVRNDRS